MRSALWDLDAAFVAHRVRPLADARTSGAEPVRPEDVDPVVLVSSLGRTLGDGDDVRALTPWLLREAADGRVELGAALERIGTFWSGWTRREREAVRDVVAALWRDVLDRPPGPRSSALVFLDAAAALGDPPDGLLAVWEYRDLPAADHHLAVLLVEAWHGARVAPTVLAWALDGPQRARLRRAHRRDADQPWVGDLAAAVGLLPD